MMIGANKDGWWDEVKLMHQSEDVLDFLEAWDTDGEYQFVGHFDQSMAHNKKNANALVKCNGEKDLGIFQESCLIPCNKGRGKP